jgi:hypothetical protein
MKILSKGPWEQGIRFFNSPCLLSLLFNIDNLQGDCFAIFTVGVCYKSIQLTINLPEDGKINLPFGKKIKLNQVDRRICLGRNKK